MQLSVYLSRSIFAKLVLGQYYEIYVSRRSLSRFVQYSTGLDRRHIMGVTDAGGANYFGTVRSFAGTTTKTSVGATTTNDSVTLW